MKALWHSRCGDIRAPDPHGDWTFCRCRESAVRWVDALRGILQAATLYPEGREYVRILGLDNNFLLSGVGGRPRTNEDWRTIHSFEVQNTAGYLFHEKNRACVLVVIAPGESNDTSWVPWERVLVERQGETP